MENTIDQEMVIYKAGDMNLQTTTYIDAEGVERGHYTNKTVAEYVAEGFEHIPFKEALKRINALQDQNYVKPFEEITAELWEEMLNVLPPQKWERFENGNIFRMSEYLTSNITAHFIEYKGRYFTANRRTSTPYSVMIAEVLLTAKV